MSHSGFKQRTIQTNGIEMHVTEAGEGPLVVLCHGWPESWYSWRHQLHALSAAGFYAVAPSMRGYGQTTAPVEVEKYTMLHLVGDMVGLVSALGEHRAIIVGHDWGAAVAWHCALLRPDIFRAVVAMSVPFRPRGPAPPLSMLRAAGMENFYWIYFQEPGVAEAEFEIDVDAAMRRILFGFVRDEYRLSDRDPLNLVPGAGFLTHLAAPLELPAWITEEEFAFFVDQFSRTGFCGGLNWYRNMDRNWELLAPWQGARVTQPALFIAGSRDPVIRSRIGERALEQLPLSVPAVKKIILEGAGHWIQQERCEEVTGELVTFLRTLS